MSFLVIFAAFLMGIAGGFLAMHFIYAKGDYVTTKQLDEAITNVINANRDVYQTHDTRVAISLDDFETRINKIDRKMNDHYGWSLGIWNEFANQKEAMANPIPESIQEVARAEVQLSEEDVKPMGPVGEDPKPGKK